VEAPSVAAVPTTNSPASAATAINASIKDRFIRIFAIQDCGKKTGIQEIANPSLPFSPVNLPPGDCAMSANACDTRDPPGLIRVLLHSFAQFTIPAHSPMHHHPCLVIF
jgi:hypothetical protein